MSSPLKKLVRTSACSMMWKVASQCTASLMRKLRWEKCYELMTALWELVDWLIEELVVLLWSRWWWNKKQKFEGWMIFDSNLLLLMLPSEKKFMCFCFVIMVLIITSKWKCYFLIQIIIKWGFVWYEEICRLRRVLSITSKISIILYSIRKPKFNNCVIIHLKYFQVLNKLTSS